MNVATITAVGTKNADSVKGQGVTGHCTTDQLVISGSGNSATPILCGTMTGEHGMFFGTPNSSFFFNFLGRICNSAAIVYQ